MTMEYTDAVEAFRADPAARDWSALPFFEDGQARLVAAEVDKQAGVAGVRVLPSAADMFNAFRLTPLDRVRVVILGQDPYPTPGDAHGLAFSYVGHERLPASLVNIYKELSSDLGVERPPSGDLTPWARQGVLLLNTALTVEAGRAAAHRRLGWERLTDQAIRAVSKREERAVFVLWGADARKKAPLIDTERHLVFESAHPSPLSARVGFFGSKPFSRANAFLAEHGLEAIDWSLA